MLQYYQIQQFLIMTTIGKKIKAIRKNKHLKQGDLAKRLKMTSAQLCRIEGSKNPPSVKTLARIAKALNISLSELMDESQPTSENTFCSSDQTRIYGNAEPSNPTSADLLIPIRKTDDTDSITEAIQEEIIYINKQYIEIENELGIPSATTLPLRYTFSCDERGAEILARAVRTSSEIGTTPFTDLIALLESKNVRIIPIKTSLSIQSRSFYDSTNHILSIAINQKLPPERQLYRIAYELGYALIFASNNNTTVIEGPTTHKFVRRFASAFLMPEEAINELIARFALSPSNWSFSILLQLKFRFKVSAETFAHRLEKVGVLSSSLRKKFKEELRVYYEENNNKEPMPSVKSLDVNSRLKLLKLRTSPH